MPNGQPAQLANLRPAWKRGDAPKAGRRSLDVDRAIRIARKHSPEAISFAVECMRDAGAAWSERLKAVQIVLAAGLPKDPDAINKALGESDGPRYLEIVFVKPGEVIEHQPKPNGNGTGTFAVTFAPPEDE
jgi:hypothetical protein